MQGFLMIIMHNMRKEMKMIRIKTIILKVLIKAWISTHISNLDTLLLWRTIMMTKVSLSLKNLLILEEIEEVEETETTIM